MVATGARMTKLLAATKRNPDFVIWAEPGRTEILKSRYLCRWGSSAAIDVWVQNLPRDWELRSFEDDLTLLGRFQEFYQRRMSKAYRDMGTRSFKPGVTADDFELRSLSTTVTAVPTQVHTDKDLKFARMREWPDEPATDATPPDDPMLRGIETEIDDGVSDADRARDMVRWVQEGQTWEGAFLKQPRQQLMRYFTLNDAAARKAHAAAVGRRVEGAKNSSDRGAKYDRVPGFSIPQSGLRPAARGKIWSWDTGTCVEVGASSIAARVGFSVANVKAAAELVHFRDLRVLQMLTETGVTHGTTAFPLACHFYPNHQGSARHLDEVSSMIREKVAERHFAAVPGAEDTNLPRYVCASRPMTIPCMQIPMNGTEQKLKPAEFFLRESGCDFKPNVRGTMNGSSPHNGESPNDHCELLEELNMPWVTITHVVDTLTVLSTTDSPLYLFKIDMRRAYQQLFMQESQTWRQHLHWCWDDESGTHCGFLRDQRMQWGAKASGSVYHRGVTTLIVKYVTDRLLKLWVPKIQCPQVRQWSADRLAAGLEGVQAMPASVDGFLDDFFFIVSGTAADRERAREVILDAFRFLGFTISTSKFKEEGTLGQVGEVLGHGIDLKALERFVTAHKKARIEKIINELLDLEIWDRKTIESLVGVIQSVKHDVPRRWRLSDLYAVVYADGVPGPGDNVFASKRAKRALKFVMDTLHIRSPLRACPTRWPTPLAVLCDGAPTMDAATSVGYGGVLKIGTAVEYFRGVWPAAVLRSGTLRIEILEALTVILTALTWGISFAGKRVLFRSDNSGAVYCLNAMKSKCPGMKLIIDQWEAVQNHFGFEAMLFHVAGVDNVHADIASRSDAQEVHTDLTAALQADGFENTTLREVPVVWSAGKARGNITTELMDLRPRH